MTQSNFVSQKYITQWVFCGTILVHMCIQWKTYDTNVILVIYEVSFCIFFYPLLGADTHFWLTNNHEVYGSISRLMSSAWDIKRKELHWWRHNGNHDHQPLFLPLRCNQVTLCLYNDLSQIKGIAGISKLQKHFRMWQTSLEHEINSLPRICFLDMGIDNEKILKDDKLISEGKARFHQIWLVSQKCASFSPKNKVIQTERTGVNPSLESLGKSPALILNSNRKPQCPNTWYS